MEGFSNQMENMGGSAEDSPHMEGFPVAARITKCLSDRKGNPVLCEFCHRLDETEYELEIQIDLQNIQPQAWIYCCTDCHEKNCPLHQPASTLVQS